MESWLSGALAPLSALLHKKVVAVGLGAISPQTGVFGHHPAMLTLLAPQGKPNRKAWGQPTDLQPSFLGSLLPLWPPSDD